MVQILYKKKAAKRRGHYHDIGVIGAFAEEAVKIFEQRHAECGLL